MTDSRPPKKSAMLEVRLSHEAKEALMARCRAEGLSASEFVRAHIERFLTGEHEPAATAQPEPAKPAPSTRSNRFRSALEAVLDFTAKPQAAAAAIGMAVATVMMINPSIATPDWRAMFERFDNDKDGQLSLSEFEATQFDDRLVLSPIAEPILTPTPCPDAVDRLDVRADVDLAGAADEAEAEGRRMEAEAERMQAEADRMQDEAIRFQEEMQDRADELETQAQELAERHLEGWQADRAERLQAEAHARAEAMRVMTEARAHMDEARIARIQAEAQRRTNAAIMADAERVQAQAFRASFQALDRNHDGTLTTADFQQLHRSIDAAQSEGMISGWDKNGDGRVTMDEFQCP